MNDIFQNLLQQHISELVLENKDSISEILLKGTSENMDKETLHARMLFNSVEASVLLSTATVLQLLETSGIIEIDGSEALKTLLKNSVVRKD